MESRLVQEWLLDSFKTICIESDFPLLIAFLVQKLLRCEQHTGWNWTTVTNPAYFSGEGWNTQSAHSGLPLYFDPYFSDRCMQVSLPLNTLCCFLPNVRKNSLPPAVSTSLSEHTESKAFQVQATLQYWSTPHLIPFCPLKHGFSVGWLLFKAIQWDLCQCGSLTSFHRSGSPLWAKHRLLDHEKQGANRPDRIG